MSDTLPASVDGAPKVHLVDGTYELFRAHYGRQRGRTQASPFPAAAGLLRALVRLLKRPEVSHVACAFDNPIESFRNRLFAGYKTGEGVEPALRAQFDLAEQVTAALGVVVWSMQQFEADDALATGAARFGPGGSANGSLDDRSGNSAVSLEGRASQVVLCSPDKDLMQCVRGRAVVVWDSLRERTYDEGAVVEKLGVPPHLVSDLLALVGDTADGIPGLPRWGLKSAATVLTACGGLDSIAPNPDEWPVRPRGAAALSAILNEQRPQAALYKRLATLREDVPLQASLSDLRYGGPDRPSLEAACRELQDDFALRAELDSAAS